MPDKYDDTAPLDNTEPEANFDPLGIMGWTIGGKYKIHSHLGGGGFGEVYEAYNENLPEQRLVIKFFKRVQAREKFAKEAKILCMLDHPNICRVIDYLPDEGAVVVAFIDGHDGGVILKKTGALPEELFIKAARGITSAIAYAHEKKIAHRDLKPGNIIIDKNENVFLIDFGIAKEMGTEATKTAYTALTPMFAAPERQSGEKGYNPFISDIYETGITLFNLATNSLPYRNPTNPLVEEWGGVAAKRLSPELTRILKKATHPDPARRYKSAAEMAEDFKNLKVAFGGSRRRTRLPIMIGLAVILIAAGAYFGRGYLSGFMATSSTPEKTTEITPQPVINESTTPAQPPQEEGNISGVADPNQKQTDTAATAAAQILPSQPQTIPGSASVEDKPAVKEAEQDVVKAPEPKPLPPPPPAKSELYLAVIPSDSVSLKVAGKVRKPGQRFDIDPGKYEVAVVQPEFPIYRGTIEAVKGKSDIVLDLAKLSPAADTIEMQIALIPPTENHILELSRNGRRQTIYNFPYFGLSQITGEWDFALNIKPIGAAQGTTPKIDSCVIFPFNPALRHVIRGSAGTIKVAAPSSGGASVARMLIYWSQPQ